MRIKINKESFWPSYVDIVTTLFAIMVVLFAVSYSRFRVKEGELKKIAEIRAAVQSIDTAYFQYVPEYKKHILKTKVMFRSGSADINDLDDATKTELLAVRDTIKSFLDNLLLKYSEASYLLIIEGQASRDNYGYNNQLSYDRALSLFKFWFPNQENTTLKFFNLPCEVVIAGAGQMEGKPRDDINSANQRFLIQIMPQLGIIE